MTVKDINKNLSKEKFLIHKIRIDNCKISTVDGSADGDFTFLLLL
jgi:hypothetical protein